MRLSFWSLKVHLTSFCLLGGMWYVLSLLQPKLLYLPSRADVYARSLGYLGYPPLPTEH